MDPCAQLRRDLTDAVHERDRELDLARRRFWLGLLGLDFILDWEERTTVDRALAGFLAMIQTGEVILALQQLLRVFGGLASRTGRRTAEKILGRFLGRTLGLVAVSMLAVDILVGYTRWEDEEVRVRRRFTARLRQLLQETHCPRPERVFREEGVPLP